MADGQTNFASPSTFGAFGGDYGGLPGASMTPNYMGNMSAPGFGLPSALTAPAGSSPLETSPSSAPAQAPLSGGGMSAGTMLGYGAMGAGLLGAAGVFGGKSSAPNLDPYGLGAESAAQAQSLWKTYNTGSLLPGDQARIAQWQQSQTKAAKDYYAKAGLSDSSMAQEAIGQIGQQADSMRSQANQNLLQPAIQATGLANQYAQEMVNYQIMQDQQKQQAQQQFFSTIAQFGAMAAFA